MQSEQNQKEPFQWSPQMIQEASLTEAPKTEILDFGGLSLKAYNFCKSNLIVHTLH